MRTEVSFTLLPPFLSLHGEPPVPWPCWYKSFGTLNQAIELADVKDAWLRAMLIYSLCSKGQRIFTTLGPARKLDSCMTLFGHFDAPHIVIVWRIVFCQRTQRLGESIHYFVADLRAYVTLGLGRRKLSGISRQNTRPVPDFGISCSCPRTT